MTHKVLKTAALAGNIMLLAAGSYLACRKPPLEERIERWHKMEYCENSPWNKEDGLGMATNALFEANIMGDKKTAAALEPIVRKMMENRDNGKRDDYCRQMKRIRASEQAQ
jgi:hypothetical protein